VDNPNTATTYNNIGTVYFHQGDTLNALEWYRKALAIQEKVLDQDSPDTAMTYNNIGEVFRQQGNYSLALPEYIKAYQILVKKFGESHRNTKAVRNNLARAYNKIDTDQPFAEWLAGASH
jgi:tetratricopeptide (TPR) repeat protein